MVELGESSVQMLDPGDLGFGPLFWSVREAVVVGDATTGRIVLWNPAAESLFGYSAAEAAGMYLENLIPERLRARHRAGLARYAVNGHGPLIDAGKPIAMPALRKDGAEISIELSLTPLQAPTGSIATGRYVLANIRDATERQRVAEANTWLAAILEATPDAIVVADSDGAIVTVNAQSERLLGYSRDELIGRSVDTLLPDRLRAGHAQHRHDFSADPRTRPMGAGLDLTARHKDGRDIPVEISLSPLSTPNGLYVVSAIRDVTERRLANQDRARLAAIVDATDDAVMCVGGDGLITAWNTGARRLYGYAADETIGRHVSMLIPPELLDERQVNFHRVMRGEYIGHFDTERLTKDGRRVLVSIATFPIRDADGAIVGAASIARDVTEQRAAEARLREIETWYRILVERMPAVTYLEEVDDGEPTWKSIYVSPQIESMLGYPVEVWMTDPDFGPTLLHAEDRDHVLAEDARTEATGEPYRQKYRMIARDGRIVWIHDEARLVRDEAGRPKYWLGFMRDITEEKQLEVERAALLAAERETAHQLQEVAALRADFSRMVAHELGSPIAAVRRSAELLATDPLTPTQEWALAVVQKEADSLRSLVDDVVAIATIEQDDFTVHLQPVRVEDLLTNAAAFGRSLSGGGPVTIAKSTDDQVLADPDRIGQVLRNLVNNSVLYSPLGTAITLRATRRRKRLRIEVADRGPGISMEDQERIFEKFARGRGLETLSIPGGGLGLYLSRRIVQAHGSDLTVASSPGQGATFGFELEVAP